MIPNATVMQIPLGVGINEADEEELVEPGSANLRQENVRHDRHGALIKRLGTTDHSPQRADGTSRSNPRALLAFNKQISTIDDQGVLDTGAASGVSWAIGQVPQMAISRYPIASVGIASGGSSALEVIGACFGGPNNYYFTLSYETRGDGSTQGDLIVYVTDYVSKATVATLRTLSFANPGFNSPPLARIVSVGTSCVVVLWGAAPNIKCVILTTTNDATISAGFGLTQNLVADWNGNDFDAVGTASYFTIAYGNTSVGTARLTANQFNTSAASVSSSTYTTASAVVTNASIDGSDSDNYWIAWHTTGMAGVGVIAVTPGALGTIVSSPGGGPNATGIFRVGIGRVSATDAYVAVSVLNGNDPSSNWATLTASHCTTAGTFTNTTVQGYTAYAKPFVSNGRVYVLGMLTTETAFTEHVVTLLDVTATFGTTTDIHNALPCGQPARQLVAYNPDGLTAPKQMLNLSAVAQAANHIWAVPMVIRYNAANSHVAMVELSWDDTKQYQTVEHNGTQYISTGQLYGFDGAQVVEDNFTHPPSLRATASANAGGIAAGTYLYCAIYEWTDAHGNVHWSEPSPVQTVTFASTSQVSLIALALNDTAKVPDVNATSFNKGPLFARQVHVKIFRTKNGGGVFYLVSDQINQPNATSGLAFTAYVDLAADTTIAANATLYTTPGALGAAQVRRPPPPVNALGTYNGMICAISDDRKTLWTSAARVVGEALWWNDVWQYPVEGDDLTAVFEQDGVCYVTTMSRIFEGSGDPPSDNGVGGIDTLRLFASDVGCVDPRSIARTSVGTFFQSGRGIEILTRAGSVEWIGEKVVKTVNQYPTITSAVVDRQNHIVIFSMAQLDIVYQYAYPAPRLVYDLEYEKWVSKDWQHGSLGSAFMPAVGAAMVWSPFDTAYVYAWLDGLGYLMFSTVQSNEDLLTYWNTALLETPHLHIGSLMQEQQVWNAQLLFQKLDPANLLVEFAYDFQAYSSANNKPYVDTVIDAAQASTRQLALRPLLRSQAFKMRMSDAPPTIDTAVTGAGLAFIAVAIDIAPKQVSTGGLKQPAAAVTK